MKTSQIKTRFAPSPTGELHIGGLRTALYSYAYAKHFKGKFMLRIEDTDRERFVEGATEKLLTILKLFQLQWDEGPQVGGPHAPYIQSERVSSNIYKDAALKLVAQGHAYYSFSKKESVEDIKARRDKNQTIQRDLASRNLSKEEVANRLAAGESGTIRLKVPEKEKIGYFDPIAQREISWNTSDVPDLVLLKSDGFPTYHLGAVVDDVAMGVSHIIRGHDWIPSTPIHLLLYKYLDYECPVIMHLTDILDPDGGKLSKRKGSVTCEAFLKDGYLPEALLNFIMLLGWAPKDNQEFFTLEEFIERFDGTGIQKSNPVFNRKKLDWFNSQYMQKMKEDEYLDRAFSWLETFALESPTTTMILKNKEKVSPLLKMMKSRLRTFSELPESFGFLFSKKTITNLSEFKQLKNISVSDITNAKGRLHTLMSKYANFSSLTHEEWEKDMRFIADEINIKPGTLFMLMRVLVTYSNISPPLFESLLVLGKEEVLDRLSN